MNNIRKEYTFFWFIENYSYCWHKTGEALASSSFATKELNGVIWRLLLYPRGVIIENKKEISLLLCNEGKGGQENVSVTFQLSFLRSLGPHVSSSVQEHPLKRGVRCGCLMFLKKNEIFGQNQGLLLPQDILTVRCKIWIGEGSIHKVAPICARTRIGVKKVSFMHVVENFSTHLPLQKKTTRVQIHSEKELVVSSSLSFAKNSGEVWMIIDITPTDSSLHLCAAKISLLAADNIFECGGDTNLLDVDRRDIKKLRLFFTKQTILKYESEYSPDDKLSLLCDCTFSTGIEFERIEGAQNEMPLTAANLQEPSTIDVSTAGKALEYPSVLEDMKALYLNHVLSDVLLKTKTKSFPAHKIILCARSPVFKAMLTSDMKEKQNGTIQIDELEDEIVEQLLLFLYADEMGQLEWRNATQLYYAADKYEVHRLKEICSCFLMENLTPANAGELLLLADTHSDGGLKKSVEEFILEHEDQIFGSDEWEILMKTNPLLVMKAMHLKYRKRKGNN